MINVNLMSGGGMERTLLSFIKYKPDNFNIKIIQTGSMDNMRLKQDEIFKILKSKNVELETIKEYDKNRYNLKIGLLSTIINTLTEKIRNRKYKVYINKLLTEADIIYLFHNAFIKFIGNKSTIVVGSFYERNPNPEAYSGLGKLAIKFSEMLIRYHLVWRRIDYYHYEALNLKSLVPKNSFYIPLGIDADKYLKNINITNDNVIRILFVGRLVKTKGIDILIDAFNIIKAKGKYELHIVGSGEMDDYIKNLKINSLIYHGQIDDDSLIKIYQRCDIFVFPSQSDIYGLVILEALASMEHIIVSDTLKGVFDDFEKIGVLEYSKRSSTDIVNRILKYKKSYDRYNVIVAKLIREKYDWKAIDINLYNTFQELVNKKLVIV